MQEIWKDIKGYDGFYQVSNKGNVKSLERIDGLGRTIKEKMLKPIICSNYYYVNLKKKNVQERFSIHKLVAELFIPDKNNFKSMPDEDRNKINLIDLEVNHLDNDKKNNNVNNLEWCTRKYNINYSNTRKIIQCDLKGNVIKIWSSLAEASKYYKIPTSNICTCCKGKQKTAYGYKWKYYEVEDE